ncbi:hypothetical protein DFJ73DRAFT_920829, partial [Zopfochytrium polystomum]
LFLRRLEPFLAVWQCPNSATDHQLAAAATLTMQNPGRAPRSAALLLGILLYVAPTAVLSDGAPQLETSNPISAGAPNVVQDCSAHGGGVDPLSSCTLNFSGQFSSVDSMNALIAAVTDESNRVTSAATHAVGWNGYGVIKATASDSSFLETTLTCNGPSGPLQTPPLR